MKFRCIFLLLAAVFLASINLHASDSAVQTTSESVRFMTFNIRYDNPDDGANEWSNRRLSVTSLIGFYQPDFLGVQEALYNQYNQLRLDLSDYAVFGVGRDDGITRGEYAALFVRSGDFQVTDSGTFWLSPTPDVPSVGWDASTSRIATWVRAQSRRNGHEFLVVNTHWDRRGERARRESASLIRNWIAERRNETDTVVLMGDLNTTPSSEPYRALLAEGMLSDTRARSEHPPFGPDGTFTGFDIFEVVDEPIDYIFATENAAVLRYGVITQQLAGVLPSDHYPIVVDLISSSR